MLSWNLLFFSLKTRCERFYIGTPDGTLLDYSTIAKVLVHRGNPSEIQTVLTCTPIVVKSSVWDYPYLAHVRLYHRLLVVDFHEHSSDLESPGSLVIMDIDTLRRYHIADDVVRTSC